MSSIDPAIPRIGVNYLNNAPVLTINTNSLSDTKKLNDRLNLVGLETLTALPNNEYGKIIEAVVLDAQTKRVFPGGTGYIVYEKKYVGNDVNNVNKGFPGYDIKESYERIVKAANEVFKEKWGMNAPSIQRLEKLAQSVVDMGEAAAPEHKTAPELYADLTGKNLRPIVVQTAATAVVATGDAKQASAEKAGNGSPENEKLSTDDVKDKKKNIFYRAASAIATYAANFFRAIREHAVRIKNSFVAKFNSLVAYFKKDKKVESDAPSSTQQRPSKLYVAKPPVVAPLVSNEDFKHSQSTLTSVD